MIEQRELMTLLNVALSNSALLDAVDSVANLLASGDLAAVSDSDAAITGLTITESGRRHMPLTLPWGQ